MSNQLINQVLKLTNNERAEAGLEPLKLNNKLASAADEHSNSMAEDDFFSHTGIDGLNIGDRVKNKGYQYQTVGENIAAGYSTASAVVKAWMNSPGHRANILNPNYTEIGIGYEFLQEDLGSVNYNHYWTQVFGNSLNKNSVDNSIDGSVDNTILGTPDDDVLKGTRGQDYLTGNNGNDLIQGGMGADTLLGEAGNDKLIAGADNDLLDGGTGSNILTGGTGADTFVLHSDGIDKVRDFELGVDTIGLADDMTFDSIEILGGKNSFLLYEGERFAVIVGTNPNDLTASNFTDF